MVWWSTTVMPLAINPSFLDLIVICNDDHNYATSDDVHSMVKTPQLHLLTLET